LENTEQLAANQIKELTEQLPDRTDVPTGITEAEHGRSLLVSISSGGWPHFSAREGERQMKILEKASAEQSAEA